MIQDFWLTRELLHIHYSGHVKGEEVNFASLQKSGDPRFDNVKYIISDWRYADKIDISMREIDELATFMAVIARQNPNVKAVSLTSRDSQGNPLAAYYVLQARKKLSWEFEIVHTLEEAYEWMGIPFVEDPALRKLTKDLA